MGELSQKRGGASAPAEPTGGQATTADTHYLEAELYNLVQSDSSIFKFLQAGSLDGLWYWDLTAPEHEWMSPRFWEVFGFDPTEREHLAAEWQDMIFDDDLAPTIDNFIKHSADPSHPYDQVVRYRHNDGSTVWVRCRGIAIRDADGTPTRMLGAHTDVTALKRAEADLEARARELERVNAELAAARLELEERLVAKDGYIASVSHELRTPLTAMLGFAELLTDPGSEMDPGQRDQMIEAIARQGMDLSHIVEDLLVAARVEAGNLHVTSVSVSLRAQAAQVLESWDPETVSGFEVVGDSARAVGDPTRVRQILRNLVSNVLRYGGEKKGVEVALLEHQALITVWDDGPGIPEADVERIFEPYQRAQGAPEVAASVGLGLTISRQLACLMGGDLTYEQRAGRSRFELSLPAFED